MDKLNYWKFSHASYVTKYIVFIRIFIMAQRSIAVINPSSAAWAEAIIYWGARDQERDRIKCIMFKTNVLILCGLVLYMYICTPVCVVL